MYENYNTMNYSQSNSDFANVAGLTAYQVTKYNTQQKTEKNFESLFTIIAKMFTRWVF